jgi:uncharacterized protein (TIGR02117 family)
MRWLCRLVGCAVAVLLAAPAVYLLAALALGLLATNPEWRPAPRSEGAVPIWLRTNGVHADLVLPARKPHDFAQEFTPDAVIDGTRETAVNEFGWIAFGWGDRAFYLNTPSWADLDAGIAWRALTAQGPSAMHVEYVRRPENYDVRLLWLAADDYARLVDYVRAGFKRTAGGAPIRIDHPGYFATDAFYEGVGSYSPVLTSNEWVRRGLAKAGVRTARWAPFERALMWQAERVAR